MALGTETDEDTYEVGADPAADEEASAEGPAFELTEELEDSVNLIPELMLSKDGQAKLKKIVDDSLEDFDAAWESTEEYRRRRAENDKIFVGALPIKQGPFRDAANIHIPMALENISRIYFRCYGEIFNDWRRVFYVHPVGPDDLDKASILTKHGNWQIRYQLPEFGRQMSRGVLSFFMNGDVVTHSWWDASKQRNCHEVLTCDDFAIPFVHLTVMPDLSDVPFKAKIMNMHRSDLQGNREPIGTWVNVDKVLKRKPSDLSDDPESLLRESQAMVQGVDKPGEQRTAPYKVIWYEGWTDAFSNDPEDRDRYIQLIVDYHSRTPMSLIIHEIPNWEDKIRFDREMAELEQYKMASAQHAEFTAPGGPLEQKRIEMENAALDSSAMGQPPDLGILEQQRFALSPEGNPPPPMPPWLEEQAGDPLFDVEMAQPARPRKEPVNTFSHAVCIEPMLGNLGIGYGNIQSDLNRAANVLMSQFVDSASLNNARSFFTTLDLDDPNLGPGAFNKVKGVSPGQLKDAIVPFDVGPGNPQMFDIINAISTWAQSSASAPDVLSGEPGKSGETAKGLMQRIEQANIQLSVPTKWFADNCLSQVLRNNALLNSMFLPEDQVFNIVNEYQGPEQIRLGRQMYERDYRVEFGSDLRFAGRAQRVAEADEVTAMIGGFPQMQMNGPFLHRALANSLRARGMEFMIPYLGPEPPMTGLPFNQVPMPVMPPPGAPGAPAPAPGGPPQA